MLEINTVQYVQM